MFNLMAVVPDKRLGWRKKLQQLQDNCNAITKDVTSVSILVQFTFAGFWNC